jgi:pimeloyl-ACP methyl ester carboxylesterase
MYSTSRAVERPVQVVAGGRPLEGDLALPEHARGVVLFAHGSGSSRHSPRNRAVAESLRDAGFGTLLFDLLTAEEEALERHTGHLRFDISLLAQRLVGATDWLDGMSLTRELPFAYFGASTGAAAGLVAAAERPERIGAVVSRGGRPDLAGRALLHVRAPTLLIVGGRDVPVIGMNREALEELGSDDKQLIIVPGATHLFEEPGALEEVARLAVDWLLRHMNPKTPAP